MTAANNLYPRIGKLVRARRERAKVTQGKLAEATGLTRTSITNIEQGRQKIQIHTLYEIAEALNIPPYALLPPFAKPQLGTIEESLLTQYAPDEREWVTSVLTSKKG